MEDPLPKYKNFGVHLTLDGYGGNPTKLFDLNRVFRVLDQLPAVLGMHKIITPYVIPCAGNDKKDPGGVSGFVMIAESHISIHTFPGRKFVSIDVYTCQDVLDTDTALAYFKEAFDLETMEVNVLERGKRFGELASLEEDSELAKVPAAV